MRHYDVPIEASSATRLTPCVKVMHALTGNDVNREGERTAYEVRGIRQTRFAAFEAFAFSAFSPSGDGEVTFLSFLNRDSLRLCIRLVRHPLAFSEVPQWLESLVARLAPILWRDQPSSAAVIKINHLWIQRKNSRRLRFQLKNQHFPQLNGDFSTNKLELQIWQLLPKRFLTPYKERQLAVHLQVLQEPACSGVPKLDAAFELSLDDEVGRYFRYWGSRFSADEQKRINFRRMCHMAISPFVPVTEAPGREGTIFQKHNVLICIEARPLLNGHFPYGRDRWNLQYSNHQFRQSKFASAPLGLNFPKEDNCERIDNSSAWHAKLDTSKRGKAWNRLGRERRPLASRNKLTRTYPTVIRRVITVAEDAMLPSCQEDLIENKH
ncbi:unnamed protein product [Nesidiocoris tenuis]|uniref:Uncharacterized protein n=1 Tax=Nesidiocoris tenuis TaxID=355587 RepID=A0A6H5HFJ6_9HEMI|nr:unnamed protein product [Nesidiocoris tenuis]